MNTKIVVADSLKYVSDSVRLQVAQCCQEAEAEQLWSFHDVQKMLRTKPSRPDLLVIDMELPGMKSFYSVKSLMEKCKNVRVLVRVPDLIPVCYVKELYDKGVHGVFSLGMKSDSLPHVISIVLEGERYMPYDLVLALMRYSERKHHFHDLSRREREIFTLISIGVSNKEIARYTGIQSSTVKVHNKSIFRKINVRSRVEARAKYLLECQLDYYDTRASASL